MFKKTCLFLAVAALLAGCGGYTAPEATASAEVKDSETTETAAPEEAAGFEKELPETGIRISLPEKYVNLKGAIMQPSDGGEIDVGCGILTANVNYLMHTKEERDEFDAWYSTITSDTNITNEMVEKADAYYSGKFPLAVIVAINGGRGYKEIVDEALGGDETPVRKHFEIGEKDGYRYYALTLNTDDPKIQSYMGEADPDLVEEYKELCADMEENCTKYITPITRNPSIVYPEIGTQISFEAEDLDGNRITSKDLFAKNEYTMVNIWRTWCDYCVEEFPAIDEMAKKYADKGVAIVTYCANAKNEELIAAAKKTVGSYNFAMNLAASESVDKMFPFHGTPFTYFVDRNGKIAALPIRGANPEKYEKYIEMLIAGEKIDTSYETPVPNDENTYSVQVIDQNGDPVSGAVIGFCTDSECNISETNEAGIAFFTGPAYPYHIQIVSVPEGYSYDKDYSAYMSDESISITAEVTKK